MKYLIDTETGLLSFGEEQKSLYAPESFEELSKLWIQLGWNLRYHYTFTWMGQPILQLPEDLMRIQELIYTLQPDLIVETGVAFGGGLLFYATCLEALNQGEVVGIEKALRPPNKLQLKQHRLSKRISILEGSSIDPQIVEALKQKVENKKQVLIILDSNHSYDHVLKELELYAPLVTPGSYLLVADGLKKYLTKMPRGKDFWEWDNPLTAVETFLKTHSEFQLESLKRRYNRTSVKTHLTHFQGGILRKLSDEVS